MTVDETEESSRYREHRPLSCLSHCLLRLDGEQVHFAGRPPRPG